MPAPLWWSNPSKNTRYAIAILSVVAGLLIAELLTGLFSTEPIASCLLCTVIFVAWLSGFGPALLAIALSLLAFHYYVTPPFNTFTLKPDLLSLQIAELPRLVLFSITSLVANFLMAAQRRATESLQISRDKQRNTAEALRQSRADLEKKVQDLEKLNAALQIEGAERRRAEEKSRRIERELQVMIDTIPLSVASFEPDGSRDFVNRPWRDYTGISSQEEARATTWTTTVHADDAEAGETEWHACLASGKIFQMDLRIRRADGEYRWNMARRVPLRDDRGNIVKWYGIAFDIDDQKRAESALRESEAGLIEAKQELQQTIDMIPAKITVYPADGTTRRSSNLTWCDYTGLSMGDKAAARSWAVAHPDDIKATEAEWTACLAKHEPFQAEVRLRRRDGVYRWHMIHRVPLRNQRGDVTKWYAVGFDIEDRKRAEDALRQSEAYLAEAQRLSHTGSFGWYVSSGEIIWSAENYRIFEYDPATRVTIDRVFDRVHPDDAAFARGVIERATADKEEIDFEHRLLMPDGSVKHLHVVAHPLIIDVSGELQFVGAVMDITARKKSEESLRNSEQRYRHLFQNMPIALWQLDASEVIELFKGLRVDGVAELGPYAAQHPDFLPRAMEAVKIEEVNERMIEMLGARDASEILGSITRYCHIHPEAFLRGLESRYRGESTHQEEAKLLTLDGRVIDVLMTATRPELITDPDMSLLGFIDITERVRAREMLQRVQADFAHAARVAMLGELTASIAHEVNQPLAAIITNGDACLRWLDRDVPQLHEVHDTVQLMIKDGNRAAEVIRRVRAMAIRQAPEQTLLSIDEVIREALTFLHHEVESHGLTVTHHPNPAAPKVLGDRTQLQQVFVNLAVNAIQAMTQTGTTRRTLVIRTTLSEPNALCCTFEDSGPGIRPDHLDHLFDSFFTTKDAGMGLGLAISRSIIEAHGGRIRADNESAHGGARFSFTLPAKPH
jgi:PAS domain S-box-containing protein